MSAELAAGEVFTDVSPGKTVTSTRLNNHVNGAAIQVGAISNRADVGANATDVADCVIFQDVSDGASTVPKKATLANLLPQTVRQGVPQYAAGVQAGGVYAVTLSPVATAYTAGMVVRFKADSANTGAVDINVNATGAANLWTRAGGELAANDILANEIVEAVYDGANFYVMNVISAAEVTATHLTEAAQDSVHQYAADAGVANAYAVTLAPTRTVYTAGMVVRFKAANANTGASTLNVNAVGAINLKKPNGGALQANDILSGQLVEAVYDGTNFQVRGTSPDFVSAEQAVSLSGATVTVAHGLGFTPTRVRWVMRCKTAELGFSIGDEVEVPSAGDSTNFGLHQSGGANATNVFLIVRAANSLQLLRYDSQTYATPTAANWKFVCYASL